MTKAKIGVMGMGVMGSSLALNLESRGHKVAIYNITDDLTKKIKKNHPDKNLIDSYDIKDFVESIEKPRTILIMVLAGEATDNMVDKVAPFLDDGDVIVDCGNANYHDTIRRAKKFENSKVNFVGMGVSGGEEGALKGPSLMPGGEKEAYETIRPILEEISAKAPSDGKPCVTYIGKDGAGHFVKMVHNGIEYGDMELIAEAYDIMRNHLKIDVKDLANIFKKWNEGELDSYLIEITSDILTKYDKETGKPVIDIILDMAGNKGTGKWTSETALNMGVALPTINAALFARYISAMKEDRLAASKVLKGPEEKTVEVNDELIEKIRKALYFSKIMSYAQGFTLYREASDKYGWDLDYKEIASIFRGGCIIRAQFLEKIMEAFDKNPKLENILLDDYFKEIAESYQEAAREVTSMAIMAGIAVPGFTSALSYYDSYRSAVLSANMIQAQRDYFGAHTYKRVDKDGTFHYKWDENREEDWTK